MLLMFYAMCLDVSRTSEGNAVNSGEETFAMVGRRILPAGMVYAMHHFRSAAG